MKNQIKTIGFDADDTLWVNEPYYLETEKEFCEILKDYHSSEYVSKELFKTEMQNLETYGFGAKSFVLSMIETTLKLVPDDMSSDYINSVIDLGKGLIHKPLVLLDDVKKVLSDLKELRYRLIVATKGDLLDQERKLRNSGLEEYFHHIEIMSNKREDDYRKLLNHLDIEANEFIMIGNSLKSDILPVIKIGGQAIYIPYHTVWLHERINEEDIKDEDFHRVERIIEVPGIIRNLNNH